MTPSARCHPERKHVRNGLCGPCLISGRGKAHSGPKAYTAWARNIGLRYKVTPDQYAAMLAAQDGKCAICSKPAEGTKRKLSIDHEHETGKVRGLLCQRCNILVGFIETGMVEPANKYLEAYR